MRLLECIVERCHFNADVDVSMIDLLVVVLVFGVVWLRILITCVLREVAVQLAMLIIHSFPLASREGRAGQGLQSAQVLHDVTDMDLFLKLLEILHHETLFPVSSATKDLGALHLAVEPSDTATTVLNHLVTLIDIFFLGLDRI